MLKGVLRMQRRVYSAGRWSSGPGRGAEGRVNGARGVALAVAAGVLGAVYVAPAGSSGQQSGEVASDALVDAREFAEAMHVPVSTEKDVGPPETFDEITVSVPGDITLFSRHVPGQEATPPPKAEIVPPTVQIKTPTPTPTPISPVETVLPDQHHDVQIIDTEGICLAIPVPPKVPDQEPLPCPFEESTGEINWDSPSFDGLAQGNCASEFKTAFACFVHSQTDPKGADCTKLFNVMQDCFAGTSLGTDSSPLKP